MPAFKRIQWQLFFFTFFPLKFTSGSRGESQLGKLLLHTFLSRSDLMSLLVTASKSNEKTLLLLLNESNKLLLRYWEKKITREKERVTYKPYHRRNCRLIFFFHQKCPHLIYSWHLVPNPHPHIKNNIVHSTHLLRPASLTRKEVCIRT